MRYEAPGTLEAAIELLANEPGLVRVLAGGTDLLVQLRADMVAPSLVVDVKQIEELRSIMREPSGFRVGAAVSGAELGDHPEFGKVWPGVMEGFELIGSTQVQGRATLGGNLCNASPAADSVPAMIASGAIVTIQGPTGTREMPVEAFTEGPGKTVLNNGELVTSFFFNDPPPRTGDAYMRFIPRTEMDIAVVGAGVCLTLDEMGACEAARLSLGAVAPCALFLEEASDILVGSRVDDVALSRISKFASAAARPIDDKRGTKEFRIQVAGVIARRATEVAYGRALGKSI